MSGTAIPIPSKGGSARRLSEQRPPSPTSCHGAGGVSSKKEEEERRFFLVFFACFFLSYVPACILNQWSKDGFSLCNPAPSRGGQGTHRVSLFLCLRAPLLSFCCIVYCFASRLVLLPCPTPSTFTPPIRKAKKTPQTSLFTPTPAFSFPLPSKTHFCLCIFGPLVSAVPS